MKINYLLVIQLSLLVVVIFNYELHAQSNNNATQLYEWNLSNTGNDTGERIVATIDAGTIGPYTGVELVGQIIDATGNWGNTMPIVANFKLYVKFTSPLDYKIEQDVLTPNVILRLKSISANQIALVAYCPSPNMQTRILFRYTTGYGPIITLGSPTTVITTGTALVTKPVYGSRLSGKLTILNDNGNADYVLAIGGKAIAESITVKLQSAWPDFVFAKNYKLPSLQATEQHILANGHLPGIPSAAEVAKDGIELGEMNKKLLQKIEELTLYLISNTKQLDSAVKKIGKLEAEMKKIRTKP